VIKYSVSDCTDNYTHMLESGYLLEMRLKISHGSSLIGSWRWIHEE